MTAAGLHIRRAPLESQAAAALIAALNREISAIYPEDGATHFRLDAREVEPGRGAFLVARLGGRACGCGAVRSLGPGTVEIKRMYVAPEARGRGIGTALLSALEAEARALGAVRLVLETGERQRNAVALSPCTAVPDSPTGRASVSMRDPRLACAWRKFSRRRV